VMVVVVVVGERIVVLSSKVGRVLDGRSG
jgi:hypothetical protein